MTTYFGERIEEIAAFTRETHEASRKVVHFEPGGYQRTTVEEVKNAIDRLKRSGGRLREPVPLAVEGTLYPCLLLSTGWWERRGPGLAVPDAWRDKLQEWLFTGFDQWAPSWDVSLATEAECGIETDLIAQLGSGDEADSIPVLIPKGKAAYVRNEFRGGAAVLKTVVTGFLTHVSQPLGSGTARPARVPSAFAPAIVAYTRACSRQIRRRRPKRELVPLAD